MVSTKESLEWVLDCLAHGEKVTPDSSGLNNSIVNEAYKQEP